MCFDVFTVAVFEITGLSNVVCVMVVVVVVDVTAFEILAVVDVFDSVPKLVDRRYSRRVGRSRTFANLCTKRYFHLSISVLTVFRLSEVPPCHG